MNILLISQCTKKALFETRRIIDQFAERRGDGVWQTVMTQAGLQTVHKLLRQTARKNTAVACYWIRGLDNTELLWIVGNAKRFNAQGVVPTHYTNRDILRSERENDSQTAEDIRLMSAFAGLLHDLGKANNGFQAKLQPTKKAVQNLADPYRHEWISLRLFEALVTDGNEQPKTDQQWLSELAERGPLESQRWQKVLYCDGLRPSPSNSPFTRLPPLAQAIGWLIVSHHRVPQQAKNSELLFDVLQRLPNSLSAEWCGTDAEASKNTKQLQPFWNFSNGLLDQSNSWKRHLQRLARQMLQRPSLYQTDWLDNPYVMHLARLSLMLADHYYSSGPSLSRYGDANYTLYANTERDADGKSTLKQRLDEHLIGVEVNASRVARSLPRLHASLPHLARHRGLRKATNQPEFVWQNKAYNLAVHLSERSAEQGFFGINMASTGCGKTLANARIMYGLAHPELGARFSIALGLRSLTLQTGAAYRQRLQLEEEDLAILVGDRQLLEALDDTKLPKDQTGSESSQDLLPDNSYVHFSGSLEDGPLNRWLGKNAPAQRLLQAPLLVCTIDHLMPACESQRGGQQIAPLLRLLSSDLVLDEPDDFATEDLYALSRLVHWAGVFGSRVLLSSATLAPALVQGLFEAYQAGRACYQANHGRSQTQVCCAWFDEFGTTHVETNTAAIFMQQHRQFVQTRLQQLQRVPQRRSAQIVPLEIAPQTAEPALFEQLLAVIQQQALQLHAQHHTEYQPALHQKNPLQHHTHDALSTKRVSFGLVRVANIDPLVALARRWFAQGAPSGVRIHLCCYHARHPLLVRSALEQRLDRWLNRQSASAPFNDPELQQLLQQHPEPNQVFIVLATAVAEVGRDHDYDWAIVEPSSMRSMIQLAGRVRRHRREPYQQANIALLSTNIRHLRLGTGAAYCRPGFESQQFPLDSHDLRELLTAEQLARLDASARIQARVPLQPRTNLADLEQQRLSEQMLGGEEKRLVPAKWWWNSRAHLSAELQRAQRFRAGQKTLRYALVVEDEDAGDWTFQFWNEKAQSWVTKNKDFTCQELILGAGISAWAQLDYRAQLQLLAERLGMSECECSRRFGIVELPDYSETVSQSWHYHQLLGFSWRCW